MLPLNEKLRASVCPGLMRFCLMFALLVPAIFASAQCLPAPSAPVCNPPGFLALGNNDNVGSGQTKVITGGVTYSNLTMNGGTLIVCGDLTVNAFTFNSGTIYIRSGASLTINVSSAMSFGSNCSIYNYGQFTTTASIVTGSNNIIYNCLASSVFNVLFNQLIIQGPNTYLVNNGIVNTGYFIVQSTNSLSPVCMGSGASINMNILINQYANSISSPSGASCIRINTQIINSQPVTSSADLYICYQSGSVSIIGAPNFGNATVSSSCTSCSVALPVELASFTGTCADNVARLEWVTASEINCDHFAVERSADGLTYETAGTVRGQGNSNVLSTYTFEDALPHSDLSYYRLRQVDFSGESVYFPPVSVSCDPSGPVSFASDQSLVHGFTISAKGGVKNIVVSDLKGSIVSRIDCYGNEINTISLEDVSTGIYILTIYTVPGAVERRKIWLR